MKKIEKDLIRLGCTLIYNNGKSKIYHSVDTDFNVCNYPYILVENSKIYDSFLTFEDAINFINS